MRPFNVVVLILCCLLQQACAAQPIQTSVEKVEGSSQDNYCSSDLREKIRQSAEGEDHGIILSKLSACPRETLIREIKIIRDQASSNDSIRIKIAFLFCKLGDCNDENRKVLISELAPKTTFPDFYPDDVAAMAAVLIRDGHKELLSPVLEASEWADGAVAEVISDILVDELLAKPEQLLTYLADKPRKARKSAFRLIRSKLENEQERKQAVIHNLKTASPSSNHTSLIKQLLEALSSPK